MERHRRHVSLEDAGLVDSRILVPAPGERGTAAVGERQSQGTPAEASGRAPETDETVEMSQESAMARMNAVAYLA